MGLQFKKSLKIGSMRINFSNGGVSYSTGVKGIRINTGRKGTFVTIGADGIYYRKKISSNVHNVENLPVIADYGIHTITSSHIDQLTDVDSKDFIEELTEKAGKASLVNWLGILPMIIFLSTISLYSLKIREIILQVRGYRNVVTIDSYIGSNIRLLPDADSKILGVAKYSEEFPLVNESNRKWLKINYHDSIGYVSKKLAKVKVVNIPIQTRSEIYSTNPYYFWILILSALFFIVLINFLAKRDKERFEMELNYEMDENMNAVYKAFGSQFAGFCSSQKIWQYLHGQNTYDWKRNAGAGKLINRVPISEVLRHKAPIKYLKTNVEIPHIKLRNTDLFFLPERLLVKRGNKFAAVFYKNLIINYENTRFIEDESVASDAVIVDYTWRYVNRNGGADRRFNNNRKIPICLYSKYTLKSTTGIYETICTSKLGAFDGFSNYLRQIGNLQTSLRYM